MRTCFLLFNLTCSCVSASVHNITHHITSGQEMEQPSEQTHSKVISVQTIPDLSPDGLALVLFFMCFILLVLGVDLLVKFVMKWRYF